MWETHPHLAEGARETANEEDLVNAGYYLRNPGQEGAGETGEKEKGKDKMGERNSSYIFYISSTLLSRKQSQTAKER